MELAKTTNKGLPGLAPIRKRLGFTQQSLADKADLHKVTIANYERGAQDPSLDTAKKLAQILNCMVDDLLPGYFQADNSAGLHYPISPERGTETQ